MKEAMDALELYLEILDEKIKKLQNNQSRTEEENRELKQLQNLKKRTIKEISVYQPGGEKTIPTTNKSEEQESKLKFDKSQSLFNEIKALAEKRYQPEFTPQPEFQVPSIEIPTTKPFFETPKEEPNNSNISKSQESFDNIKTISNKYYNSSLDIPKKTELQNPKLEEKGMTLKDSYLVSKDISELLDEADQFINFELEKPKKMTFVHPVTPKPTTLEEQATITEFSNSLEDDKTPKMADLEVPRLLSTGSKMPKIEVVKEETNPNNKYSSLLNYEEDTVLTNILNFMDRSPESKMTVDSNNKKEDTVKLETTKEDAILTNAINFINNSSQSTLNNGTNQNFDTVTEEEVKEKSTQSTTVDFEKEPFQSEVVTEIELPDFLKNRNSETVAEQIKEENSSREIMMPDFLKKDLTTNPEIITMENKEDNQEQPKIVLPDFLKADNRAKESTIVNNVEPLSDLTKEELKHSESLNSEEAILELDEPEPLIMPTIIPAPKKIETELADENIIDSEITSEENLDNEEGEEIEYGSYRPKKYKLEKVLSPFTKLVDVLKLKEDLNEPIIEELEIDLIDESIIEENETESNDTKIKNFKDFTGLIKGFIKEDIEKIVNRKKMNTNEEDMEESEIEESEIDLVAEEEIEESEIEESEIDLVAEEEIEEPKIEESEIDLVAEEEIEEPKIEESENDLEDEEEIIGVRKPKKSIKEKIISKLPVVATALVLISVGVPAINNYIKVAKEEKTMEQELGQLQDELDALLDENQELSDTLEVTPSPIISDTLSSIIPTSTSDITEEDLTITGYEYDENGNILMTYYEVPTDGTVTEAPMEMEEAATELTENIPEEVIPSPTPVVEKPEEVPEKVSEETVSNETKEGEENVTTQEASVENQDTVTTPPLEVTEAVATPTPDSPTTTTEDAKVALQELKDELVQATTHEESATEINSQVEQTINKNDIRIGSNPVLEEGSSIYTNSYNAYFGENSHTQYYKDNPKRVVLGVAVIDQNGNMNHIFASSDNANQRIDNLINEGGQIVSILTANQDRFLQDYTSDDYIGVEEINAYAEGWYNINSVQENNTKGLSR